MFYTHTTALIKLVIVEVLENQTRWIPPDEANPDYQRYLAWIAEGNTAEPWQPESTTTEGESDGS